MYSGDFVNGIKEGFGEMKWLNNGEKYIGEWKEDVQHGKGLWL